MGQRLGAPYNFQAFEMHAEVPVVVVFVKPTKACYLLGSHAPAGLNSNQVDPIRWWILVNLWRPIFRYSLLRLQNLSAHRAGKSWELGPEDGGFESFGYFCINQEILNIVRR